MWSINIGKELTHSLKAQGQDKIKTNNWTVTSTEKIHIKEMQSAHTATEISKECSQAFIRQLTCMQHKILCHYISCNRQAFPNSLIVHWLFPTSTSRTHRPPKSSSKQFLTQQKQLIHNWKHANRQQLPGPPSDTAFSERAFTSCAIAINTYDVCFRGWAILGIRFS